MSEDEIGDWVERNKRRRSDFPDGPEGEKAYGDWGGAQCGYCTPGFIMTVKALLEHNPEPSDEDIRQALSGNLCRCTGYTQMYQAIKAAIRAEQEGIAAAGR